MAITSTRGGTLFMRRPEDDAWEQIGRTADNIDRLYKAVNGPPRLRGVRVVLSELMVKREQYRFPRSQKRRVREKWAKQERNWRTLPDSVVTMFNVGGERVMMMHPAIYERVKRLSQTIQPPTDWKGNWSWVEEKPQTETNDD